MDRLMREGQIVGCIIDVGWMTDEEMDVGWINDRWRDGWMDGLQMERWMLDGWMTEERWMPDGWMTGGEIHDKWRAGYWMDGWMDVTVQ